MPPHERLTTRILHPHDPTPSTEDIFSSALETLFTDDTQQSHGVPGQSIIYRSPRFGDVYLQIPAHPGEEGGRLLFAHYLWNAGVLAAEAIERASCDEDEVESVADGGDGGGNSDEELVYVQWDKRFWDMRGRDVLELGAATALPSLICALSNARSMTSTDHPSSPAITMNAIDFNFKINFLDRQKTPSSGLSTTPKDHLYTNTSIPPLNHPQIQINTTVSIYGYSWGTTTFNPADSSKTMQQPEQKSFDRIIVADCLWMPAQHENLVRTIVMYLTQTRDEDTIGGIVPCALVVAGFHTGRDIVSDFIEIATGSVAGDGGEANKKATGGGMEDEVRGQLRAAQIFEVDVDGRRRSWEPQRPSETKEQSKRWCMCAVLVRR